MKMTSKRDENGLVAILVATMIMIIMSLVVLGFAHLMQREQRAALDKSLSTQAFYAAESGINDAVARFHNTSLPPMLDKTTCDTTTGNASGLEGTLDTTLNASYSCLLIDTTPPTLEYTQKAVTTEDSKIVPIKAEGGVPISSLQVFWDQGTDSTAFKGCPAGAFPASGSWGSSPGILRFDLVPTQGTLTRANLISGTLSAYLYPVSSGAGCGLSSLAYGPTYTGANAGRVVPISCSNATTPRRCSATITGLGLTSMYIRMRSVYDGSNVTIRIFDASNNPISIEGAQVLIDSTGRVGDVVRRIQVRAPAKPTYEIPDDALETTLSICKELAVVPGVSALSTACNSY